MPLLKTETLSDSKIWGIWKLTESLDEIFELVNSKVEEPLFADITHPNKIKEWAGSRILAAVLCDKMGWNYAGILKDEYGKPYLSDWSLGISVSHKYPYVTVLLDKYHDVGIDVELVQERILRLAPKFMNSIELEWATSAFQVTAVWAGKEALYKLHGRKQLIFKEQLEIMPLEYEETQGKFSGKILDNGIEQYELRYQLDLEDLLIVYSL